MGNINYQNFICDNYYCHSLLFKPEWFSESSWNIDYSYKKEEKPYVINKGIIKIYNVELFNLILSKKLLIDFNEIKNISIPIKFRYKINNKNQLNIYIIISNKLLLLKDIDFLKNNIINDSLFYIQLKLFNKKCSIFNSINDINVSKDINSEKINMFTINLENNLNMLLIYENLNNNNKNIYDNKYFYHYNNNLENNFYLSIFINSMNDLISGEFIELNFE